MKVALVYDRVNKFGGVERVLQALHRLWPDAPLFTAVYNPKTAPWAKDFQVVPSFLQRFPLAKNFHELYPWLTPLAFESFRFDDFDLVISVTSAEAKAVLTKPHTLHICYCLTPTRYLWSHRRQYLKQPGLGRLSSLGRSVFKRLLPYLQKKDLIASARPDYYLAISKTVQKRIEKYYHRRSLVVYPPVDYAKFAARPLSPHPRRQPYFLVVSRLVPYKRIDLAIRAFNQLKLPLKIVGVGRQMPYLKKISGQTIQFLGQLTDKELISYYQQCQALIMPGIEDFGLVSLECQAAGRPVIAYQKGGALETVVAGKTGLFFSRPTPASLAAAVRRFLNLSWSPRACRANAQRFNQENFLKNFKTTVEVLWQKHQQSLR